MHSGGFELTKLTYYTRLEDTNLIRHRGDRLYRHTWYTYKRKIGDENKMKITTVSGSRGPVSSFIQKLFQRKSATPLSLS